MPVTGDDPHMSAEEITHSVIEPILITHSTGNLVLEATGVITRLPDGVNKRDSNNGRSKYWSCRTRLYRSNRVLA